MNFWINTVNYCIADDLELWIGPSLSCFSKLFTNSTFLKMREAVNGERCLRVVPTAGRTVDGAFVNSAVNPM